MKLELPPARPDNRNLGLRWENYRIRDGVLCHSGRLIGAYALMDHPTLLVDLSKLSDGDQPRVRLFAATWGLMGRVEIKSGDDRPGDSLEWLWAHARGVRRVLELRHYIQREDYAGLETYLESVKREVVYGTLDDIDHIAVSSALPPKQAALTLMATVLSSNLRHHDWTEVIVEEEELTEIRALAAPIVAVYLHLWNAVKPHAQLKRCEAEDCGRLFVRTHGRQLFCPPSPDWISSTGSRCGARQRKRRLRRQVSNDEGSGGES